MTTKRAVLLLAAIAATAAMPALDAQSGRQRQRGDKPDARRGAPEKAVLMQFEGKLKLLTPKTLSLEIEGDQTMEFRITKKTGAFKGEKPVRLDQIEVGAQLTIEGKRELNGDLNAINVRWNTPAETSESPKQ